MSQTTAGTVEASKMILRYGLQTLWKQTSMLPVLLMHLLTEVH